jgi:hypothetical protein
MMNSVRYLNKDVNGRERENYSRWWREQINHYVTKIRYYTNGYTLTSHNFLYGEDPTSAFEATGEMVMFTSITNDSIMLSKFGIMADCDMTAVVHISAFRDQLGPDREPKAGDLIEMHEYGGYGDRPGFRGAPIYEITERDDEHLELTNTLLGHYVWHIKCKRWEYSYEPGMQPEPANIQINDGGDYGRLAGGENPEELIQPYPDSADNSAQCIYDYYDSDNEEGEYTPQFTAGHFIPIQERLANSSNAATFATQTSGIVNSSIYDANVSALIDQSVELNKDLLQAVTQKVIKTENDIKTFTISTSGLKDKLQYTMKPGHFDLFNLDGGTV